MCAWRIFFYHAQTCIFLYLPLFSSLQCFLPSVCLSQPNVETLSWHHGGNGECNLLMYQPIVTGIKIALWLAGSLLWWFEGSPPLTYPRFSSSCMLMFLSIQISISQLWCSRLQRCPPPLHHAVQSTNNQQLIVPLKVCVCVGVHVWVCMGVWRSSPLNVLSACHAEWVDVVRTPAMSAFQCCLPNSCPPTLLLFFFPH